jgi:hypothetical protein
MTSALKVLGGIAVAAALSSAAQAEGLVTSRSHGRASL